MLYAGAWRIGDRCARFGLSHCIRTKSMNTSLSHQQKVLASTPTPHNERDQHTIFKRITPHRNNGPKTAQK